MTLLKRFVNWTKETVTDVAQKASDIALMTIERPLNQVGLGGVIPDSAYSSKISAQAANMTFDLSNKLGSQVLNKAVPGSGTVLTGLQNFNPSYTPTIQNPGNYPEVTDNSLLLQQQLLAQQQKQKEEEAAAALAEAEKKEQMQNFIALGAVGVLVIVLVMTVMKR